MKNLLIIMIVLLLIFLALFLIKNGNENRAEDNRLIGCIDLCHVPEKHKNLQTDPLTNKRVVETMRCANKCSIESGLKAQFTEEQIAEFIE